MCWADSGSCGEMPRARLDAVIRRAIAQLRSKRPTSDPYASTSLRLRNARATFAGAFVALVFLALVPSRDHGVLIGVVLQALHVLPFVCAAVGIVVIYGITCPRCSKRFTFNGGWTEFWASRCCWCGLEQWSSYSQEHNGESIEHVPSRGSRELPNNEMQRTKHD